MTSRFTLTKEDLDHLVSQLVCPAHYAFIFAELVEAYSPNQDYSLQELLLPFEHKEFTEKAPGMWYREVRYADYLCPLFYAAYVCKGEFSSSVIKEVVGFILKENGHFYVPPEVNVWDPDVDRNDHRQLYWGQVSLSPEERARVDRLVTEARKVRLQAICES